MQITKELIIILALVVLNIWQYFRGANDRELLGQDNFNKQQIIDSLKISNLKKQDTIVISDIARFTDTIKIKNDRIIQLQAQRYEKIANADSLTTNGIYLFFANLNPDSSR